MDPDHREMLERIGQSRVEVPNPRYACACGAQVFRLPNGVQQYNDRDATVHECRVPPIGNVIIPKPDPDPILDSNIDIPLDRIAREFRKRAGRAYGLGDDGEADDARTLCRAIEDFDRKWGKK